MQDEREFREYWRRWEHEDDVDAGYQIARCYENGYGTERDPDRALDWYIKAADHGQLKAIQWLRNHKTRYGDDLWDQFPAHQRLRWNDLAAEQGDGWAAHVLISEYDAQRDFDMSMHYIRVMADAGDADYMLSCGVRTLHGLGTEKNEAEAVKWFQKAAKRGNASAMCAMAKCYTYGGQVAVDEAKARKLYAQAITARCKALGVSMDALDEDDNQIIDTARGVILSLSKCPEPVRASVADAAYQLGQYHYDQWDIEKGIAFFRRAAHLGHPDAMRILSVCYAHGFHVPQDKKLAERWHRRTRHRSRDTTGLGLAQALFVLANIFSTDAAQGHADAGEKMVRYLKIAAQMGHANAMYLVGMILAQQAEQEHAEETKERAIKTLQMAADLGSMTAVTSLQEQFGIETTATKKQELAQSHMLMSNFEFLTEEQFATVSLLLEGEFPESKAYTRAHPSGDKFERKRRAAYEAYVHAHVDDIDDIFLVYDTTAFGGADEGFCLTAKGVATSRKELPFIDYSDIGMVKVKNNQLYIDDVPLKYLVTDDDAKEYFCSLLKGLHAFYEW